jgi:hypothetical protein
MSRKRRGAFEASEHLLRRLLAIHDDHQRRAGSQDIVLTMEAAYLLRCEAADGIWRPAGLKRQRWSGPSTNFNRAYQSRTIPRWLCIPDTPCPVRSASADPSAARWRRRSGTLLLGRHR